MRQTPELHDIGHEESNVDSIMMLSALNIMQHIGSLQQQSASSFK